MFLSIKQIHTRLFVNVFIQPFFIGSLLLITGTGYAQKDKKPQPPLAAAKGKLVYVADSLGNRIPDFSYCGYKAGDKAIPDATIRVVVPVKPGDATRRIQAALDYVSTLPVGKDNLRGASWSFAPQAWYYAAVATGKTELY